MKCMCSEGQIWNGQTCNSCPGGKIYMNGKCCCPIGQYWQNNGCTTPGGDQCGTIPNSNWDGTNCVCKPGFEVVGYQCVCNGLDLGDQCDRCYNKPHSFYYNGICKCKTGYYEFNGQCVIVPPNPNPNPPADCNPCTFFEPQEKRCVPCADGCLSCETTYECLTCREGFSYNFATKLCDEICGDGIRFVKQCDDGNNDDMDGCAPDCTIEPGWICYGGSPSQPDSCTSQTPAAIQIVATGQTHLYGQIILNVQLNYLPLSLLESSVCNTYNQCKKVLDIEIVDGFNKYTSIVSKFIPGSSFTFSIVFEFGIEPIGIFDAKIGIKSEFASFFGGVDISPSITVTVNPALLARYEGGADDSEDILA